MSRPPARRPAPGQLRQRLRREVRQVLVDAAAVLLVRDDPAFSLRALADEVGCSIGAIYRYFPSKEAIVDAVRAHQLRALLAQLARRDGELERVLTASGAGDDVAALARVIGCLRGLHDACLTDPPLLGAVLDALLAPLASHPETPSEMAGEAVRLVRRIAGALEHAHAHAPSDRDTDSVRVGRGELAVAITVSVITVSLAARAGSLPVTQAAWCGRQWTLAALRVAGGDAAHVHEATELAWPIA